jgi:cobalt-zinc-cadmium efflux system outer membrane protein
MVHQAQLLAPRPEGAKPEAGPEAAEELPLPTLAAPAGLTLDQAINAVLLADPKVRIGLEAINQANAALLTSKLLPNPQYFHDIQLLPLTEPFTPTRQGGPPQMDIQVGLPIDWLLFGKRAAAMASAAAGVRVSEAEYANRIRERTTQAAVAFFDVLEAQALARIAQQDLDSLTDIERKARKAADTGVLAKVEQQVMRLEMLRSQQVRTEAEGAVAVARARLRALLGHVDGHPEFEVAGSLDVPALAVAPHPGKAFALAQDNRPDIHALRLQVAKARADVLVQDRNAWPQVVPTFGYTRQYQAGTIGFPDANSWSAALSTDLPFFTRNQGGRARARSVVVESQLNLDAALLDLRAEIEQAVQDLRTASQNAGPIAQERLRLAEQVRATISHAHYTLGTRTLADVLEAQSAYRDASRQGITGKAAYWRALYRLNAAVGKQLAH